MLNAFSNDSTPTPACKISMHNPRVLILTAAVACALSSVQSRAQSAGQLRRSAQPLQRQARRLADTSYDVVIRNGRVLDGAGQSVDSRRRRDQGRPLREDRQDHGARQNGDRRDRQVRESRLDRHDGPVGRRAAAQRARREQAAGRRDDGDRRRGRHAGPRRRSVAEYFATLERQGISINFGSYFSETQARVAVLGMSARAPNAAELDRMRAIMDTAMRGGAMGMTTALIYPPSSYTHDRRAGRGREGRGEVRRRVREPHSRRRARRSCSR